MFEPQNGRKEIRFYSLSEEILRIRMFGYNDFKYLDSWEYFRLYSWETLHYVISGSGKLFIRGKEYVISAGDFFFIPKNEAVMYYADKDDPWKYMLYVSPRHLSRLFHERVGMTPVAYLAEIRLTAAADILRNSSMTVSELCRAVGWGDELYFMKKFKKKFDLTVGEWREKMLAAKLP